MITRGIQYYNLSDLTNSFYLTLEAKALDRLISEQGVLRMSEIREYVPMLKERTSDLNFFIGDFELIFVPKKSVHLYLVMKDLEKMMMDPIKFSKEIENTLKKTKQELEDIYDDLSTDKDRFKRTSCYLIIYSIGEGGMKQLHKVLTGIPMSAYYKLTDSRVYKLNNGEVVTSHNGIPEGVYYYYDRYNKLKYTRNKKKGTQVGSE
jgi:hypothetical protein